MPEMTNEILGEILAALTTPVVYVDELPEADPKAVLGRRCADLFTNAVGTLRDHIPNDRIRAIARVIWDLVGAKQVWVATGPRVETLSFTVTREAQAYRAMILIPPHWPELVKENTFLQLGAVLFVGAQAVDFYNDRLIGDHAASRRWFAYEAELLHTFKRVATRWTPEAYQQRVMGEYPHGLDSENVKHALYPFKSYEASKGST